MKMNPIIQVCVFLCVALTYVQANPVVNAHFFEAGQGADKKCTAYSSSISTSEGTTLPNCALMCMFDTTTNCNAFNFEVGTDGCQLLVGPCTTSVTQAGSSYFAITP